MKRVRLAIVVSMLVLGALFVRILGDLNVNPTYNGQAVAFWSQLYDPGSGGG